MVPGVLFILLEAAVCSSVVWTFVLGCPLEISALTSALYYVPVGYSVREHSTVLKLNGCKEIYADVSFSSDA